MRRAVAVPLAFLLMVFTAAAVQAGDVKVKGVHLCCGQCTKAVGKALSDVDGVSGAACDREEKTVTFSAADEKAAKAGIAALAKAGFHGKASHGDKKLAFPKSGAKKGQKADTINLTNVHVCCGRCVTLLKKALDKVDGVQSVSADRDENAVTIEGSDIDVSKAVAAMNGAGFHAKLKKKG